jgi:hypothetical protein
LAAPLCDEANWTPSHNPWLVALTVTLATFMEVLDTSIANVALPHMAGTQGGAVYPLLDSVRAGAQRTGDPRHAAGRRPKASTKQGRGPCGHPGGRIFC